MCINNVSRTCKLMTAALKDSTPKAAHHLVVNSSFRNILTKGEKALVLEIDAYMKPNEVVETAGRESRTETSLSYGKIRELELCVTVSKRPVCWVRLSVPGVMR